MTIQNPVPKVPRPDGGASQSASAGELRVSAQVLSRLMPMHLVISPTGHIAHTGPTLVKILADGMPADGPLIGRRFLEVFQITRPSGIDTVAPLRKAQGLKLHMVARGGARTAFKAVAVADQDTGVITLNLSFGIGVIDAVRDFALTSADFAPYDLTVEMLYLVEAKSAVMEESRQLNLRLQGAMIAAEERAYTDGLTGLKNRRAMDFLLEEAVKGGAPFAVMNIDLDFFKAVNDGLGHAAGDHVLMQAADILTHNLRESDHVARVGGDEFVVLAEGARQADSILQLAQSLIAKIEAPIPYGDETCQISASIGIAMSGDFNAPSADEMLHAADMALYASKRKGRAQASVFSAETPPIIDRASSPIETERRHFDTPKPDG